MHLAGIFLSNLEWRRIAILHSKDLWDKADETVTVFIVPGNERIRLEKFDGSLEYRTVSESRGAVSSPGWSGRQAAFDPSSF